jgi:four helix bundle protein
MVEKEEKAFRKLLVWKRAHELTLMIYKTTETFPKHELFALTNQVRRSVVSVEANIAEGYALGTAPNYLRHLNISIGSLAETECHLEIAHDLGYFSDSSYNSLAEKFREVGYLPSRLKASIERNHHQSPQKP